MVLTECITHAALATNVGSYHDGEWEICKPLLAAPRPDMLRPADRGFNGYEHWRDASQTGAQLL